MSRLVKLQQGDVKRQEDSMPLPKPNKNESQDDFIGRCMGEDIMKEDYPDQKQRLAVCFSQWNKKEAIMDNEKRGALPRHKTDTSTSPWDGPANEARLKLDQDEDYYKRAYAWRDPDKDPKNKTSYKFIHHEVSEDGNPGAANIKGCQSGIGILNGARGGADIPAGDKQGVWNHLAGHLRDADVEPAPLRSVYGDRVEWRALNLESLEVRDEEGKAPMITGIAAPFGKLSEPIMGQFQEKIDSKAFDESLDGDIRCLFNHEPNYVLGRTMAGTLRLQKDKSGLKFENDPPDTQWARDLQVSIRRGDVNQMSFAFECLEDSWDKSGEMPIRTLKKVKLFDISIVTYPAYPQTKVGLRGFTEDELINVLDKYFQPKADEVSQAPQELTEGYLEIVNRRQAFLKLIK
jgi:HK97 family phage prohead protease